MSEAFQRNKRKKKDKKVKSEDTNYIGGGKALSAINFKALIDSRFMLAIGFFLMIFSLFICVAFISYVFTGQADQSVLEALGDDSIKKTGGEIENWLGITGAMIAHLFMYKWFGLASFLILPISFSIGYRLVFKKEILTVRSTTVFSLFFLFWLSITLGYFVLATESENSMGLLSGGIGYELAVLFDSIIGWGTFLLLIFFIIVFIIYYFNISKVDDQIEEEELKESVSETDLVKEINDVEVEEKLTLESVEKSTDDWKSIDVEDKTAKNIFQDEPPVDFNIAVNKDDEPPAIKDDFATQLETIDLANKQEEKEQNTEEQKENLELDVDLPIKEEKSIANEAVSVNDIQNELYDPTLDLSHYNFPTVDLLKEVPATKVQVTKEELEANKDKIVTTLSNYNIGISSIKATIGPTVTLYEIVPEAGVRISKIKNLEDDIALSLAALGIRIIAPIPGKGTIGIEVPNTNREMVMMKPVILSEKFAKTDMSLPVAFGRTISNDVFVADLAKMPHLLMAGATGQGKSVGINVILASLLFKKHPSQLKFVLVDPKKVELTLFNKIEKHFLAKLPNSEEAIITDTKKVIHTLNSLCIEMDTRYNLLKEASCRNLKEYNKKFVERKLNPEKGHRYLPFIVLVIDELADLMMTAGKEVETPIARLAQLARAIGIHLIVATQRPSVNVITGVIKANFPSRLSFRVTSKIDSRTILDAGGAEQLIGMGDMLLSQGSDLIRIQCAFIDTPEVENVCEFIGDQQGYPTAYELPEYEGDDEGGSGSGFDFSDRDAMFEEAARVLVTHQQGSTSLIQRKLSLGYNRAGRIIDQLEAVGIVGAFEGSKAREVLVPDLESLEQLLRDLGGG